MTGVIVCLSVLLIAFVIRKIRRVSARVDQIVQQEIVDPKRDQAALRELEGVCHHSPPLQRNKIAELTAKRMLDWASDELRTDYYSLTTTLRLRVELGRRTSLVIN